MSVISDYRGIPDAFKGASVALGNFDGVHKGHQAVIDLARAEAKVKNAPLGVLVFEPPPRQFFQPNAKPFRLMYPERRQETLLSSGVDVVFELPFNAALSAMSPRAFVEDVLVNGLNLSHLVVGFDFKFGKGRVGDVQTLRALSSEFGFKLTIAEPVQTGDEKISSTLIRTALRKGRPEDAARLLGRPWLVEGRVEHGEKRGRTLGFPTANFTLGPLLQPKFGIYAVRIQVDGASYSGVANFGRTPTTGDRDPLFEVYIFDFNADIYGEHLEVELISFLRPEEKFETLNDLVAQMHKDAEAAKRILE